MQIRVPVDDTHTRFMLYTTHAPDGGVFWPQHVIPDYELPVFDEHGDHVVDYVEGQDMMTWVTQGPITDRTLEHLGKSDIGVTMLRRMFKEQLAKVENGEDPLGVIREPHDRIDLPCEKDKFAAGHVFALNFIDMGSTRYSPQVDLLRQLHIDAARAREPVA
jgi:5,5'-dehydrodivanillate O-demethylase